MEKSFNWGFEKALEQMKKGYPVTRDCIKNDTVMLIYKDRLYQMSISQGVRFPYVPTNADLLAEDWALEAPPEWSDAMNIEDKK